MQQELKNKEKELQSLKNRLSEAKSRKVDETARSRKAESKESETSEKPKKDTRQILMDLVTDYDTRL